MPEDRHKKNDSNSATNEPMRELTVVKIPWKESEPFSEVEMLNDIMRAWQIILTQDILDFPIDYSEHT